MSPRPRTVDDCTILEAALRVLRRVGPERLTLAGVGAEAGLSAATLVQRFGSKREMMLRLFRHGAEAADARFTNAMTSSESPLEALFVAAMDRIEAREGPATLSNRLAFMLSQLDDPEFHAMALDWSNRAIERYKRMIEDAIQAGELSECCPDPARLAQTVHAMTFGSLTAWSIFQQGSLRTKVRSDLEMLLNQYRQDAQKQVALPHHKNASRPKTKRMASPPVAA